MKNVLSVSIAEEPDSDYDYEKETAKKQKSFSWKTICRSETSSFTEIIKNPERSQNTKNTNTCLNQG